MWRVRLVPDYLTLWLPGTLIVGLGIGLTFPVISAAAVSSLEPARYSVGSAVNQTARQIGGALGVAILVVVLGTPTSASAALRNFRHLWWYVASMAALPASSVRSSGDPRRVGDAHDVDAEEEAKGVEEMLDGEIALDPLSFAREASERGKATAEPLRAARLTAPPPPVRLNRGV